MKIYIRISENQKSLSGESRWNSFDKKMILRKCWISLQLNITSEDSIDVYHHDVSKETLKWLDETSQGLINFHPINSIEESFEKPITDIKLDIIKNPGDRVLYAYLEDDYLWTPDAFKTIKKAAEYWNGFIVPNDTPKNYTNPKFSKIYVGIDRHWRTASHISWNLIGTDECFTLYGNAIAESGKTKNYKFLNELLKETECINPMPAVATHCKDTDMSPLVNWGDIWQGITI